MYDVLPLCTPPGRLWECVMKRSEIPPLLTFFDFNFNINFVSMLLSESCLIKREAPIIWIWKQASLYPITSNSPSTYLYGWICGVILRWNGPPTDHNSHTHSTDETNGGGGGPFELHIACSHSDLSALKFDCFSVNISRATTMSCTWELCNLNSTRKFPFVPYSRSERLSGWYFIRAIIICSNFQYLFQSTKRQQSLQFLQGCNVLQQQLCLQFTAQSSQSNRIISLIQYQRICHLLLVNCLW
jgi:hypothetical protein